MTRHWLMKSEPEEVSIDDLKLAPAQVLPWTGVRNYQARNFMRDDMHVGDNVLFYHSSCAQPGIAGLATIAGVAVPDTTQFDRRSPYYDPKSTPDKPRWLQIDVRYQRTISLLTLQALRGIPALASLRVLQRGNRLSITPVSDAEWLALQPLLQG